jgi:hypothetical protein
MVDCNSRASQKILQNQQTRRLTHCRPAIVTRQKLQRFRKIKNQSLTKPA